MSKTQQYLRRKEAEKKYPKIWVVISTRDGVTEPVSFQVLDSSVCAHEILSNGTKIPVIRYTFDTDDYPYGVDIKEGEISSRDDSYGSGFGDLWSSTKFASFDKDEAVKFYETERLRVKKKYQKDNLKESDLDVYDVFESANGNMFIKITNKYSIAIGPRENHEPYDHDLDSTQYIKGNDVHVVKKVGKLVFD